MYSPLFLKMIDYFRKLPQVGNKAAERYVYGVLAMSEEEVQEFADTLIKAKEKVKPCKICFNLCESDLCYICEDHMRDKQVICVVNSSKDVIAMEKTQQFKGLYHVLGGEISPAKGILPEDIRVEELIKRLDENVKEVIIATNSTMDGETTALYLSKLISQENIIVSRLAHGIPMGGQLDYADELTLAKALEGRRKY